MHPKIDRDEPRCGRAFTLTELLVVVAILGLVVATRLPALCRTKSPAQLSRCLNNCRQIGQAALFYRNDNNDAYPYGDRVTYGYDVIDPTGWPMQLLRYMGGYHNVQPKVYLCPSEINIATEWVFQLHYQANRVLMGDMYAYDSPRRGAPVQNPGVYWLFIEKGPWDSAQIRPGGLANPILQTWNVPPGVPQLRRHSGGMTAAAADGHVEGLQLPSYQPGRPAPDNFVELGDCASGQNPASTWLDNGSQVKLFSRYNQSGF
jgi:prepilin-type N-terminal cleavage/methylation domain-containing protein/prepilin-type processing-associated H-X9-DG protein